MRLTQAEISDFQSIRRSNAIEFGDITCFLGPNEAGKTALLQALYRLNPVIESDGDFDVVDDFPRSDVEDYEQDVASGARKPATVIRAQFQLEHDDLKEINEVFGPDVITNPVLTVSKGYENVRNFSLAVNTDVAFKYYVRNANVPESAQGAFYECLSFADLLNAARSQPEDMQLREIADTVAQIEEQGLDRYIYLTFLRPRLPKFVYFDDYYQLKGYENLEALKQRIDSGRLQPFDYPMLGLLRLARLDVDQLLNPRRTQVLINKLEGASLNLTRQVLRYWSQNRHLHIKFDVRPAHPDDPEGAREGTNIWASVFDAKHGISTLLGARSRGFVWFFSFLAWYSQLRSGGDAVIMLLDEPGLSLHARAQADLLQFFEDELKPNHQLIYTTHSPFMLPGDRLDRLRIVEDRSVSSEMDSPPENQGTKVLASLDEASEDSLLPLRGYFDEVHAETVMPAPAMQLLVEDICDVFYLRGMSRVLERDGRFGIPRQWVITPVGGIENASSYVAQFSDGNRPQFAVLISNRAQDNELLSAFHAKSLVPTERVRTYADFANKSEAAVEDMFRGDFYTNLVNAAFRGFLEQPLADTDFNAGIPRMRDRVKVYLKTHPLQGGMTFAPRRPARLFADNIDKLDHEVDDETRDRFASIVGWLQSMR